MGRRRIWVRRLAIALLAVAVLVGAGAAVFWWKLLKPGDAPAFTSDLERFNHGSLGGELLAGIPYPIFWVLPRVFPDLVEQHATAGYGPEKPGHGGWAAFGLPWEEGAALPAGAALGRRGVDRVSFNCAACHTTRYRLAAEEKARFAVGGPGHTVDVQALLRFLFAAANDRRFTAARLLPEIALHFPLDWVDWGFYAAVLIPKTRTALRLAEGEMAWMDAKPAWGPGRDDAFNLPKYLLGRADWDDTIGNTDFPALWRLGERAGGLFHAGGQAATLYDVTATSAFGLASLPGEGFETRNRWLVDFLDRLEPPPFPLPVDAALAAQGEVVFGARCASCHAVAGARAGTSIPLDEVGTDGEHVRAWTDADARRVNRVTGLAGVGAEFLGAHGYVAKPLTGVWLLGPYLHNGSVPTVRDLLEPPERRPSLFWRGWDVIDPERLGFVSTGPAAEAYGFRFDTSLPGNGNGGHLWGTDLPEADKRALVEYLKTR